MTLWQRCPENVFKPQCFASPEIIKVKVSVRQDDWQIFDIVYRCVCVFLRFFYAPTRFASRGISLETFCLIIYCIFRASFCQAFSKFPTASFAAPATASSPRPSQQIIVLHLKWRRRQWRRRQRHKMSSHSSTILSSVKWPKSLARFPKMIWQPCLIVQSCLEFR